MYDKDYVPPAEPPEEFYPEPGYEPFEDVPEPPDSFEGGYLEDPYDGQEQEPPSGAYGKYNQQDSTLNDKKFKSSPAESNLKQKILETLELVLSAADGMVAEDVRRLVETVDKEKKVLDFLNENELMTLQGVFEVLRHECAVVEDLPLDINVLPVAVEFSTSVRLLLQRIAIKAKDKPKNPYSHWQAVVEAVQRYTTKTAAMRLIDAIDSQANTKDLMKAYKHLEQQPPTTQKSVVKKSQTLNVIELVKENNRIMAGKTPMRFSSGMWTLDYGYTKKGDPLGLVGPGQMFTVMGPTGTGKSSFSYAITPAMCRDLVNYGLPDAKVVLLHTEEESIDKAAGCRMKPGQTYANMAEMLIIKNIGTSRIKIVETLYDLVLEAEEKATETARPITDFLPYIVQLDYIQAVVESDDKNETDATSRTAELILRGICAWDPEEMAKFSGVSFREYSGHDWPKGMEGHRVATIAYAQLVKGSAERDYYKPNKRDMVLSDFALPKPNGELYWDVEERDLRLFTKADMRGSGVIANNSHAIIILHRSRPEDNPVDPSATEANGREHLTDTRARIIFNKARSGTSLPYAPLEFDRQVDGPAAQYFDAIIDLKIEEGYFHDYDKEFYRGPGSPVLPIRPAVDPFANVRY